MSMLVSPGRIKENLLTDFLKHFSGKIQYCGNGSQSKLYLIVGLMRKSMLRI